MAVRKILRMGDPVLRQISEPVSEFGTPELESLIADMLETMVAADGAGLAAVQVGVPKRIMIFGFESNARYPDVGPIPFTVLINPELAAVDDEMISGWEGCLSVPDMRGLVKRHARVRYRGCNPQGAEIERDVDGFHARVFQHEFDHLNGVLYPDLIDDPLKFGFCAELEASGIL